MSPTFLRFLILSTWTLSLYSQAAVEITDMIYGDDDRTEVALYTDSLFQDLANSTAIMMPFSNLKAIDENTYTLEGAPTLQEKARQGSPIKLCPEVRFSNQAAPGIASAFLIAPDIVLTAGHIAREKSLCTKKQMVWVFGFHNNLTKIKKENVYFCKEILAWEYDDKKITGIDYGVIRLEREVTKQEPLALDLTGNVTIGEEMVVIGYPLGISAKITDRAFVRNQTPVYFVMNSDTFHVNSGSAVFNQKTGKVTGIVVRGDTDFIFDRERSCLKENTASDESGRGEDATKLASIPILKELIESDRSTESSTAMEKPRKIFKRKKFLR